MRYSRIMRTWFLMSCYWRILFQKVKWIATPLLGGKQCPTRAKYDRLGKPSTHATCYWIEFGQTLWPLLRNLSCSQDQDHVHSTFMCCSYTGSTQYMFSIHPKMFYFNTGDRHKNKFVRINAPSSCECLSWKVSIAEKEVWAMQKLFIKERKEKVLKK